MKEDPGSDIAKLSFFLAEKGQGSQTLIIHYLVFNFCGMFIYFLPLLVCKLQEGSILCSGAWHIVSAWGTLNEWVNEWMNE